MVEKSPYPNSLAGTFRGFLEGFRGDLRDALGAWFLREKGRLVRKSGRSVCRGLSIPANEVMLKQSGLWARELWYFNSVPSRYDHRSFETVTEGVPLPFPPDRLVGQVKIPPGWGLEPVSRSPRVRAVQRVEERQFWDEVVDLAWGTSYSPREAEKEYWKAVSATSFESSWYRWKTSKLPRKGLFKFLIRFCGRTTRSRLKSAKLYRFMAYERKTKRESVWVRRAEEDNEFPDPAGYMQEMVQRKIQLVPLMESPYLTLVSEGWLEFEEAADRYIR